MSYIRIDEIGSNGLDRVNKLLAGIPGGVWKAIPAALKRAGDAAKTKAGRFAAAEYTIKKGDFMRNSTAKSHVMGGSGGVASVSIGFAGNVLPLLMFHTKFSRDGRIQTQVRRGGGAAALNHAFAANIFGPVAVFERVGLSRFPVEQKFGPSTAQMMENDKVVTQMDKTVRETYDKRIEHEINRVLNGWGNGS